MQFELPKLSYSYTALEPIIDAKTMEIHHQKHHGTYVVKLNEAVAQFDVSNLTLSQMLSDLTLVPENVRQAVRNHGGGHYNHSLFWETIGPRMAENPAGVFGDAMNKAFGSYEGFKEQFTSIATARFGSGWAWLGVNTNKELVICSTPNQDNPLMKGEVSCECMPILGCDVWEHAYYLTYQNRRPEYVTGWFEVVNWMKVADKYMAVINKG